MGIFFNTSSEREITPLDGELAAEVGRSRKNYILSGIFSLRSVEPDHEEQIGRSTGNTATAHLFESKVHIFRGAPTKTAQEEENEETMQGMVSGDQFGGLHRTNLLQIVDRADKLAGQQPSATDEIAQMDADYSFTPIDDIQDVDMDAFRDSAEQSVAQAFDEGSQLNTQEGPIA